MTEDDFMRVLDPGERFIWLLDRVGHTNFLILVELSGHPLGEAVVRRGLDHLQAAHPLLSARVIEAPDGTIAFHREQDLPIPLLVQECTADDWRVAIEAEFNVKFAEPRLAPLRCHLLRLPDRTVLALTFFHAMS